MSENASREADCFKSDAVAAQIASKAAGYRKNVFHGGKLCSGCYNEEPLPGQRYGRQCHRKAALASYHRRQAKLKQLHAQVQELSKGRADARD